MKLIADTHAHTLVSGHAYSTIKEMAQAGAEHGLKALALTEHAPDMPGTCGEFYFMNLKVVPRELSGIQMLFGVELNLQNSNGDVDLRDSLYKPLDIVIASIHSPCFKEELTIENNTKAYVNAMHNPYINIIGHPDDSRVPVDYEVLVKTARETKTLLEVNNSSMNPRGFREGAHDNLMQMLELCKQYEVPITTGSDAHVDIDAGVFDYTTPLLKECNFPEELVVTTDLEKLKPFINRYKNM